MYKEYKSLTLLVEVQIDFGKNFGSPYYSYMGIIDLAFLLLGVCPREISTYVAKICTRMFMVALFIIDKNYK